MVKSTDCRSLILSALWFEPVMGYIYETDKFCKWEVGSIVLSNIIAIIVLKIEEFGFTMQYRISSVIKRRLFPSKTIPKV